MAGFAPLGLYFLSASRGAARDHTEGVELYPFHHRAGVSRGNIHRDVVATVCLAWPCADTRVAGVHGPGGGPGWHFHHTSVTLNIFFPRKKIDGDPHPEYPPSQFAALSPLFVSNQISRQATHSSLPPFTVSSSPHHTRRLSSSARWARVLRRARASSRRTRSRLCRTSTNPLNVAAFWMVGGSPSALEDLVLRVQLRGFTFRAIVSN